MKHVPVFAREKPAPQSRDQGHLCEFQTTN